MSTIKHKSPPPYTTIADRDARINELTITVSEQEKEIERLKADAAQVANQGADAARYQWLRHEHDVMSPLARCCWKMMGIRESSNWGNLVDGAELDRLIDAAMLPPGPEGSKP